MEKAEAIKILRETHDKALFSVRTALETLIPGLKESEDERIRKAMLQHFKNKTKEKWCNIPVKDIISYLEKQNHDGKKWIIPAELNRLETLRYEAGFDDGVRSKMEKQKEQKPVEPSDEELQRHQYELYDFKVFAAKQAKEHHISFVHDFEWNNFCEELLSYFNEKQKPAEWSEEELVALTRVGGILRDYGHGELAKTVFMIEGKLANLAVFNKSIWRPSEEQIEALERCVEYLEESDNEDADILAGLYEQLEKLM